MTSNTITATGQKAPSAKRCIKTWLTHNARARRNRWVRKHRAPKGGLRQPSPSSSGSRCPVRKHRAPKGALRRPSGKTSTGLLQLVGKHRAPKGALRNHVEYAIRPIGGNGQNTPSAKRCIKTACGHAGYRQRWCQKAPSAKRCIKTRIKHRASAQGEIRVRKHRAPNGALRPIGPHDSVRCRLPDVRKHRAPNGALRHIKAVFPELLDDLSESAKRHKAHLDSTSSAWTSVNLNVSESTKRYKVH